MSFSHYCEHSSPPFTDLNILKPKDIIKVYNILIPHYTVNNTPVIFRKKLDFKGMSHKHSLIINLGNVHSRPKDSFQLLHFKTYSGKASIEYIGSIMEPVE